MQSMFQFTSYQPQGYQTPGPYRPQFQPQFQQFQQTQSPLFTPPCMQENIVTRHPDIIPTKTYEELKALKAEVKGLKATLEAATTCLANSSLFTKESSGGLIKRVGGKPKVGSKVHTTRRNARAMGVLEISRLIQGDDIAKNVTDILRQAHLTTPGIKGAVLDFLCEKEGETVADNRFNESERLQEQTTLIPKANAFAAMVNSNMTASNVDSIRTYGGKRLIESATVLQKWAAVQPEMPAFEFVLEGRSTAVYAPMVQLVGKLMSCKKIVESFRTAHPYKPGKIVAQVMVSNAAI